MDKNVRDQVVERLKTANNVLVTVSRNPSVDQLAACIGLTLLLNKLGKHATAVFSGKVPSTIEFLQPAKTLEKNTDSLRDFIIALDKAKADKLRYKVEDEVVKIFITPYKTSISQKDLQFSQGDFNVDVVMALGVHKRDDLDLAIIAHGRILHDAEVIAVNTSDNGNLGTINWTNTAASSLCEMLVAVGQQLNSTAFDSQMANAFLTGIVAETERFSNAKVSPETMTTSSILMSAGASTQLVAAKLEPPKPAEPQPIPKHTDSQEEAGSENGELSIAHGPELPKPKLEPEPEPEPKKPDQVIPDDVLDYELHDEEPDLAKIDIDSEGQIIHEEEQEEEAPAPEPEATPEPEPEPPAPAIEPPVEMPPLPTPPEPEPEPEPKPEPIPEPTREPEPQPAPSKSVESAHKVISQPQIVTQSDSTQEMSETPAITPGASALPMDLPAPTPILTHDTSSSSSAVQGHKVITPLPAPPPFIEAQPTPEPEQTPTLQQAPQPTPVSEETINDNETLEDIEESVNSPHLKPAEPNEAEVAQSSIDSAREAVNQAIASDNSSGSAPIAALNAQPLGEELHNGANVISPQPATQSAPESSTAPPGPPPLMPPPIIPT